MTAAWDMHAHLVPRTVIEEARRGAPGLAVHDGTLIVDGKVLPMAALGDPGALLARLDRTGLAGAVVSVPPALFRYHLPQPEAARWTALVNAGLAEIVRDGAGRFAACAYLPMGHPDLAVRTASGLPAGFAGAGLGPPPGDATLADDDFDPLWTVLQDRSGFAFFHPVEIGSGRIGKLGMDNLLGTAQENALAAASLIFGDVVGRYPGLRFVLSHGGGPTALIIGRWQRAYETGRAGGGGLTLSPVEAARRITVDSIVHFPDGLRLVHRVFGQVVLGSDWPFPMAGEDPAAGIPDDLREEVFTAGRGLLP